MIKVSTLACCSIIFWRASVTSPVWGLSALGYGWERIVLTALVEFIRGVVTETVRACGLQEPKDEADNLHQRQESGVREMLVW